LLIRKTRPCPCLEASSGFVLPTKVSSSSLLRQLNKLYPCNLVRPGKLLSIRESHKKQMLMVFQHRGGTLTESQFHLLIQLKVLATIFSIRFIVLPGILVLPHLKRHLPELSDKTSCPVFCRRHRSLGDQVCRLNQQPSFSKTSLQKTTPSNPLLSIISGSQLIASKIGWKSLPIPPSQETR
jgi:hypothetical protein